MIATLRRSGLATSARPPDEESFSADRDIPSVYRTPAAHDAKRGRSKLRPTGTRQARLERILDRSAQARPQREGPTGARRLPEQYLLPEGQDFPRTLAELL